MAQLSSIFIKTEKLAFRLVVNVNKDGRFTATLPAEVSDQLKSAMERGEG